MAMSRGDRPCRLPRVTGAAAVPFWPLGLPEWYLLVASRILGVPLIAGLSFEVIKWAGRNRGKGWVQTLMWPGMQLQKLTTREPDHEQLAVAIAAMEAVLAVEDVRLVYKPHPKITTSQTPAIRGAHRAILRTVERAVEAFAALEGRVALVAGASPTSFLKARLKAASDS